MAVVQTNRNRVRGTQHMCEFLAHSSFCLKEEWLGKIFLSIRRPLVKV